MGRPDLDEPRVRELDYDSEDEQPRKARSGKKKSGAGKRRAPRLAPA